MEVIEPGAWIAQPWKNGAGTTHELVRWPADGPFALRISVAEITAPAPFSAFAGYRRWLYLLSGGPVTLAIEGEDRVLAAAGDGVAFAGDAQVAATVVTRPSRDLNFMIAAEHAARCEVRRRAGTGSLAGRAAAVFAIAGDVRVSGRALARHACAWARGESLALALGEDAIAAVLELP